MACFSCGEGKQHSTITLLEMYKKASKKTGKIYWYFQRVDSNNIQIMNDEDFKTFMARNKKAFSTKKIEYARVDEFIATPSN